MPDCENEPRRGDGGKAGLISRRTALLGIGSFMLAGCSETLEMPNLQLDDYTTGSIRPKISVDQAVTSADVMYAAVNDLGNQVPAVPYDKIDKKYRRQIVVNDTGERPGTIVVHLKERLLYLTQPGNEAIRYGVGIGKAGFEWNGRANIQYGRKWPTWTPPKEMIARKPELAKWAGGQPGGLENPLGARALYIFKDGQDTGYRVHGSPEWWSIGQAMSSGCVRLINQDIIDLYSRVNGKTPIVVG